MPYHKVRWRISLDQWRQLKSTLVARSGGDRSPRSPKSTPVARSGGDRSPRSPEAGSGEVVLVPWADRGPCSRLAWFCTLSLHLRCPTESALVPKPGNKCYGLERVRSTRSRHEHANVISIASRYWPHLRVRTSPEVGPEATVGTSGLGYPLLLCQDS